MFGALLRFLVMLINDRLTRKILVDEELDVLLVGGSQHLCRDLPPNFLHPSSYLGDEVGVLLVVRCQIRAELLFQDLCLLVCTPALPCRLEWPSFSSPGVFEGSIVLVASRRNLPTWCSICCCRVAPVFSSLLPLVPKLASCLLRYGTVSAVVWFCYSAG